MSFRATPAPRVLLRAALTLSAAGAALAAGAGAAQAVQLPGGTDVVGGTLQGITSGVAPVENLQLYPMAGTTVDPLTNGVGTQIADFKPVGTTTVTKPLSDGDSLAQLPVAGGLLGTRPIRG